MVTLAEAITLAETNSPTVKIIGLQGQIAAEGVIQAKGERRPRVILSLEYVQTSQNIINQDNTTFQEGRSNYPVATVNLTITQPLYDAVRFRQLPIAQAEEVLAQAQAESDRMDLSRQVVAAYLGVGQAQNRLREAERILQVRSQFAEDLEQLVASGRADSDQLFRAQSDALAAQSAVADADAGLAEALFDLQRFTGVEVGGVQGGGSFSIADPRSLGATFSVEALEEMNPAIQIAKAELALAEKQLAQVQGRFRPTANLEVSSEYTQSKGSLFGGGSTVASVDVGLSVEWSIYEGGVRRSQLRVAEHQVEIAKLRIEQARDQAEARFIALSDALTAARAVAGSIAEEQRVSADRAAGAEESLAAGSGKMETVLEAGLRRDVAEISGNTVRMRIAQIQAEIFALFGALDTVTLSRDFAGG